jgi:transcriptional regulator
MYQPAQHREDRLDVQHALIQNHPLGLLISTGVGGPLANAIPFILQQAVGPLGQLQTHMARANDQWREIDGQQVLAVFQGLQSYISPSFYQTKRETGKVVPTWNYVMVQVRGVARLQTETAWLDQQIAALTAQLEKGRSPSWAVSDAPRGYIESQLRGIVGIEIDISVIEGKWKVSQNKAEADRRGVVEGLSETDPAMAQLVKQYGSADEGKAG